MLTSTAFARRLQSAIKETTFDVLEVRSAEPTRYCYKARPANLDRIQDTYVYVPTK